MALVKIGDMWVDPECLLYIQPVMKHSIPQRMCYVCIAGVDGRFVVKTHADTAWKSVSKWVEMECVCGVWINPMKVICVDPVLFKNPKDGPMCRVHFLRTYIEIGANADDVVFCLRVIKKD